MKNILLLVLATFSTNVLADNPWEQFSDREEGIKITSTTEDQEKYFTTLKTNGYIKRHNKNALNLMKEAANASKEINSFSGNNDPRSTHLRKTKEEIPLTFIFPEIKSGNIGKVYGFAPALTYVDGKWTGGVEIFESNFGLSCRLTVNDSKINHSAAFISEISKTSKVNGKVTTQSAVGDDKYGYMYIVSWYDNNFFRDLECASKIFDPTVIDKMVEIAKYADT